MDNKYITEICDVCLGKKEVKSRYSWMKDVTETCWKCHGTGFIPNKEGRELLQLVNMFHNNNYRSVYLEDHQ